MIEEIAGCHAELHAGVLVDGRVFEEPEIEITKPRTLEHAVRAVTIAPDIPRWRRESSGIKPAVSGWVGDVGIAHLICSGPPIASVGTIHTALIRSQEIAAFKIQDP